MRFLIFIISLLLIKPVFAEDVPSPDDEWLDGFYKSNALLSEGKFAEAQPLAEQALESYVSLYGEHGEDYGYLANSLGNIYFGLAEYDEAEPLFQAAWRILEKRLPKDSPDLAAMATNVASVQKALFDFQSAKDMSALALRIYEKNPAAAPEKLFQAHFNYASIAMLPDYEGARRSLDEAKRLADKHFARDDTRRALTKILRARLELVHGNLDDAEQLYIDARKNISFKKAAITWLMRSYLQDTGLLYGLMGREDDMVTNYTKAGVGIIQPKKFTDFKVKLPTCSVDQAGLPIYTSTVVEFSITEDGSAADPAIIYSSPTGVDERSIYEVMKDWRFPTEFTKMEFAKRAGVRLQLGCMSPQLRELRENTWRVTDFGDVEELLPLESRADPALQKELASIEALALEADFDKPGDITALIDQYLKATDVARNALGVDAPELVAYYRNIGRLAILATDSNTAQRYLRRAIKVAEKSAAVPEDMVVGAHWDYAYCAALVGHDRKAFNQFERLIEILEEYQRPRMEIMQAKLNVGIYFSGRYQWNRDTAEDHLNDILTMVDQSNSVESSTMARALAILAESKIRADGLGAAKPILQRITDLPVAYLDETSPIRRFAYMGLGDIALENDEKAKASEYFAYASAGPTAGNDLKWKAYADKMRIPLYPKDALRAGIQGWAVYEFVVDDDGDPMDVQLIESYPPLVFGEAAKKALEQSKYLKKPPLETLDAVRSATLYSFRTSP